MIGVGGERAFEVRRFRDRRLPVVGVEDHGVALEERVGAAGRVEQRHDRRVGARERDILGAERAVRMRGEVEVGEVVREEVETVARDEPAADRRCVHVDRAAGAVAHGERRARRVGFEEAVVEEALRPVRGLRDPGKRRLMPRAAAVARDVHRCGDETRVLERLVDGDGVLREVMLVHVEDRVGERLRHPRGAQRRERRAVLDDAALLAVPPDEMRDVMHVGPGAGHDRREADRREGREDGRRAAVRALLGEERERRCAAAVDGALERRGRHAVDDDQDELLGAHFASVRRPA